MAEVFRQEAKRECDRVFLKGIAQAQPPPRPLPERWPNATDTQSGRMGYRWGNPESASRETCHRKYNGQPGCAATGRISLPALCGCEVAAARIPVAKQGWDMNAKLFVCTTCRAGEPVVEGQPVAGTRLYDTLKATPTPHGLTVMPVECLSACNNGCAVALSAPGRWSYVYGRLAESDAPDILTGAAAYAASADGLVPWRERPAIFRKQSLARIPPQEP